MTKKQKIVLGVGIGLFTLVLWSSISAELARAGREAASSNLSLTADITASVINTLRGVAIRVVTIGGIAVTVALCSLFYKFRAPVRIVGKATDEQAYALLEEAVKLEARGQVSEALTKYQEVITKCGHTAASKDAQQCIQSLRNKAGQNCSA